MSVLLKWNRRCLGDSIKVYRSETPIAPSALPATLATLAADAGQYEDTTVEVGTSYFYLVEVVKGSFSAFSQNIQITTEGDAPVVVPVEGLLRLFQNGEVGFAFKASETSKIFTKAIGQSNVSVTNDPVGRILDQSKDYLTGPNLMTNGNNGAFTSDISGVTALGGTALSRDTSIFPAGALKAVSNGGVLDGATLVTAVTEIGKTYWVRGKMYVPSSNSVDVAAVTLNNNGGDKNDCVYNTVTDTVFDINFFFTATSTSTPIYLWLLDPAVAWGSNGDTVYVTDITVNDIDGNHATQTIAAKRPTWVNTGGKPAIAFNSATIQYMTIPNFNLNASDEVFVSASFEKTRNDLSTLFELGDTVAATDGSFSLFANFTTNSDAMFTSYRGDGTQNDITSSASYPENAAYVATVTADISAPLHTLHVNGTAEGSSTSSVGAGNFTDTDTLWFGKRENAPEMPFGGKVYGAVIRNKVGTALERTDTETYLGDLAGLSI